MSDRNQRYSYFPVNRLGGTTETVIVTGPGALKAFIPDATTTGTVTIRDGTQILPAAPTSPAAAAAAGGSLANATYFFKIAAVFGNNIVGPVSSEVSATTSGGNNSVSVTWTAVAGANFYQVYFGTTTNTETAYFTTTASPFVLTTVTGATTQTPAQGANTNLIATIPIGLTVPGRDFYGLQMSGCTVQMSATGDSGLLVWDSAAK